MNLHLSRKKFLVGQNRNSFATPRSIKYLGMVAVAVSMASCTQDVSDEPQVKLTKSEVVVNNNSDELSKRVTMYGGKAPLTRAGNGSGITMPAAPESPRYDLELDENYKSWAAEKKDYCLPAGKTLKTDLQFRNNVYYVGGELTVTNYWGQGKLVVLPGCKVNYPSVMAVNSIEILNYGEFEVDGNSFTVNKGATFMTSGDFSSPALKVGGTFYVGNAMDVPEADVYETAVLHIGCGLVVEKHLAINNSATVYIGSYLSSPVVEMNSASLLRIKSGCLVSTGELLMRNPSSTVAVAGDDMEYAVLSADKIEISHQNVKNMFTGWMDIHYKEIDNRSGKELEWLSSVKLNGDTYLPAAGCHPSFGQEPNKEPETSVGLEHIAQVESPDHAHDISSSCIQTTGDKAYVSYHTRGTGYHGCIEVLNLSGNMCSILSYMEHTSIDFNHLIVDNDRIIAAGDDPKLGAFLGIVNLGGGIFQPSATELTQVGLGGASANCVVRNGSSLYATTNEGCYTLDATSFNMLASVPAAGSSKFVHTDGTNMGVLSLTDRNSRQSMATLDIYGATDYRLVSPERSIALDMVAPVNGKNVFQLDGNDVYVCLGTNGVKRYSDGVAVAGFKLEDDAVAAANGLAVDGKYVYVAYGHGGLFVLDKSDLSVVASYRYSGGKSANYVTVSGDILYVAYGLSGVQIFKLIEK